MSEIKHDDFRIKHNVLVTQTLDIFYANKYRYFLIVHIFIDVFNVM